MGPAGRGTRAADQGAVDDRDAVHRAGGALRQSLDPRLKEAAMFEPLLGLIVAILLGIYLVFALLNPERF